MSQKPRKQICFSDTFEINECIPVLCSVYVTCLRFVEAHFHQEKKNKKLKALSKIIIRYKVKLLLTIQKFEILSKHLDLTI